MNFGDTPRSIENGRKALIIYAFASLGSVFLISFGLASLFQGRLILGGVLLAVSALVMALAYFVRRIPSAQPISVALSTILLFLSWYLVLGGGVHGTGFYWSYVLTMLMVLMVGPRIGTAYMMTYLVVLGFGLVGDFSWVYAYQPYQATRLYAASVALAILLLASEWVRVMSYGAITNTAESHRELANKDQLTGAMSRIGVNSVLAKWPADTQAALVLVDLDHFKAVNDNHGHAVGDEALVKLSELIQRNTKGKDLVARWGGEEFLLLLPNTPVEAAGHLMDSIRERLERDPVCCDNVVIPLTFSAGVALMSGTASFESAFKVADANLYAAKNGGRNRVVAAVLQEA